MSQNTTLLSDLENEGRLSAGILAYLGERARNRCYDHVLKKFRYSGLSKADLARRIGKGPDRVNKLLSGPGNWTIDTIAELLAGIAGEEFVPTSESLLGRHERNITQSDLLGIPQRRVAAEVISNDEFRDEDEIRFADSGDWIATAPIKVFADANL